MQFVFGGQDLTLHHSGALIWPARHMVVVADMHLEKGAYQATRGFYMPPFDAAATLTRLLDVIEASGARQLVVLGDSFYSAHGFARMDDTSRRLFNRLHVYNPIWIKGNSDGDYVPPGGIPYGAYESAGLTFCHEAGESDRLEISGHFHPMVDILHLGQKTSRPCFVEDGNRLMLPSFGSRSGGLSARAATIRRFFGPEYRCHLLGDGRLHSFSNRARAVV